MTDERLVEAAGVGMSFGAQPALRDVSLAVRRHEFVSIVGPSGCGKSTLLRMVAGLVEPTGGRLTLAGQPPAVARRDAQRVAFVFQDPRLLPWRTVAGNVRLPLELARVPRSARADPVADSLRLVGLSGDDARKRPRQLSGGMRMRVSLARALVTRPDVMLLDEPFAALDDVLRQQLNEELVRLWSAQRWTALFVTHNVAEAVFLSQRVLVVTRRPGTIAAEIPVPFPYPREPSLRGEAAFARLTEDVGRRLREAAA